MEGVDHVLVTVSDVTERNLSEALLRAGERRLRLALDAARAGSWERKEYIDVLMAKHDNGQNNYNAYKTYLKSQKILGRLHHLLNMPTE